jgi:5-oxoprolinase (ATP-hydrolysing)
MFHFAIDRGGTFTDVFAKCPGGEVRVMKLLSVDPANYADAPTEGIRRILQEHTPKKMPQSEPIDTEYIGWIRMGTTVATNALLERKGERMAMIVTKGFRDLLHIGNQTRPKLFDLNIQAPDVLYEEVVEVNERVFIEDERCKLDKSGYEKKETATKETVYVSKKLDLDAVKRDLKRLLDKGIKSLAVVFMHSFMFREHEETVGKLAESLGFSHVSLSSQVMPMVRIVPRGFTASVDAYLTPCIKGYLKSFASGFKNNLEGVNVTFMQSDGGLTPMDTFNGSRAIISGPAGGVVGYAMTTHGKETDQPVIGFDMGGTSTDVSRYDGSFDHVFETTTAGVTIQAPQLDVNTVAAGGGSMLFFRSGLFVVGPESASAHPGPVCYRKGGPLAITDANLCLGRILPDYFPKIFGPKENEALDKKATMGAFQKVSAQVNTFLSGQDPSHKDMSMEEVAMGFIRVANEAMCRPIRALTQGKGYDTAHHVLACFGGAGGQHACSIARSLGMKTVYVHKYAGILSAYGMALADVVHEAQIPCAKEYTATNFEYLDQEIGKLKKTCANQLAKQGFVKNAIETNAFLHLRYNGTDCALMCAPAEASGGRTKGKNPKSGDFLKTFISRYQKEFGFTLKDRKIFVDDIRVRGVAKTEFGSETDIAVADSSQSKPKPSETVRVYFEGGFRKTGVHMLKNLKFGVEIVGPAIIMDQLSTILIEPECTCVVSRQGNLKISIGEEAATNKIGTKLDTIQLSIFSHRFMSIAEQMGRILQRTSISTNIKERLDFSCALFGPDGGLVSNAPHIPVHLGAMQDAVRHQMKVLGANLRRGDVILANHPKAGGSHLPDLTIITPVFYKEVESPVFFVANRGHHADIGGKSPGSMPPDSNFLWEEGAAFKSFKIVDGGLFKEKELIAAFEEPGKYPGCSGTRCLQDNLSDLNAQIASNQKGIQLVSELIDYYSLEVVQAYMKHIQENAEVAVREMLMEVGKRVLAETGSSRLHAEDFMDDGSKIKLLVKIDVKDGTATCDFTGTGPQVWGNTNAPRAVTFSALIYSLRCMVGHDIPLNQGCLNPVKVVIPEGSILDPSEDGAVVGGNVLTSQRIVDVCLRAFDACAASQGCCNNVTFGDEQFG